MALYTICIVHLESPINEFINVAQYLITNSTETKQKGKDKLTESYLQSHYFLFDVTLQTPTKGVAISSTITGFTSETALRNSEWRFRYPNTRIKTII